MLLHWKSFLSFLICISSNLRKSSIQISRLTFNLSVSVALGIHIYLFPSVCVCVYMYIWFFQSITLWFSNLTLRWKPSYSNKTRSDLVSVSRIIRSAPFISFRNRFAPNLYAEIVVKFLWNWTSLYARKHGGQLHHILYMRFHFWAFQQG